MADEKRRLARIFIWKESLPPDNSYVATLVGVANPAAVQAVSDGRVSVHTFNIVDHWPANPWEYATKELEGISPAGAPVWTDKSSYELVGWQGTGSANERVFVVSAYALGAQSTVAAPVGLSAPASSELTPSSAFLGDSSQWTDRHTSAGAYVGSISAALGDEASRGVRGLQTFPRPAAPAVIPALATGPGRLSIGETGSHFTNGFTRYYVGFGPRLLAWLIDLGTILLFTIVGFAVSYLVNPASALFTSGDLVGYIFLVATLGSIYVFYHVGQVALWGQTVGKKLLGIRIVKTDGATPSWGSSLLRVLGFFFSTLLLGWGLAMLALDPRRQSLHDKMSETFVIPDGQSSEALPGLPGYSRSRASLPTPTTSDSDQQAVLSTARGDQFITGPFLGFELDSARLRQIDLPNAELARALFKKGLAEMQNNIVPSLRGFRVDNQSARLAATSLREALEIVPTSVLYRYFYAVALRYAEGFEQSLREFKRVLELDPGNYEARQQVTYGPRWHDAYAYPDWPGSTRGEVTPEIPPAISALLPPGSDPVTRLILLREGANKLAAFITRVPRGSWPTPAPLHMTGGIHVLLSRTSFGPVLALYVMLADFVHSPYIGETFLNPTDAPQGSEDACQLGQHLFEQLSRQDHTHAIFVDENNRLLLTRRLPFDTATQVMLARILYETQSLPKQALSPDRFRQGAEWHMQNTSLQDVAEELRPK